MNLRSTQILDLLRERHGRYIEHDMGKYAMKEPNGYDVIITENGNQYPVEPVAVQMDDLMDAGKLSRHGSRYYLAS